MVLGLIRSVVECFCGKSTASRSKKQDMTLSNDRLDALEGGRDKDEEGWDDEFDSWDKKPTQPMSAPTSLQRLDDFDGMAPAKSPDKMDEPDFFGSMAPTYVAPKQIDVTNKTSTKSKAPVLGIDDDVDIDLDSWETGNARKPKKKLAATRI